MLRLHEFITIIRNTKTIAEERAEYQKEMSAIRESFGVYIPLFRNMKNLFAPEMLRSCSSLICRVSKLISDKWSVSTLSLPIHLSKKE